MSTTVTDKDFSHSGSDGSSSRSSSSSSSSSRSSSSSHNGTVYMTARHSQKVVIRNESGQAVRSTTMSRGEHRSFSLAPGTYTIVATSSDGVCVVTVTIQSSATSRITIGC